MARGLEDADQDRPRRWSVRRGYVRASREQPLALPVAAHRASTSSTAAVRPRSAPGTATSGSSSGLDGPSGELTWRRIASGLFQPLGLKVVDGKIYVGCRDQIVILRDLNGDGETDFYENFNSDHQVTEHFHEFAMDLQTDAEGNFYYAKAARHGKTALVPQHGTLLKVEPGTARRPRSSPPVSAPPTACA